MGSWNATAIGFAIALLTWLVLLPLAVLLAVFALPQFLAAVDRGLRSEQLVVPNLTDSTGDDAVAKAAAGLSMRFREHLYHSSKGLLAEVQVSRGRSATARLADAPVPTVEYDDALGKLVDAAKEAVPDKAQGLVGIFRALIPKHGRSVATALRCIDEPPHRLALAVEVDDLGGSGRVKLTTFSGNRLRLWGGYRRFWSPPAGELAGPFEAGAAYMAVGRYGDAADAFKDAVVKAPDDEDAKYLLRATAAYPSVLQRAEAFLDDAAEWLALLLFRERWLGLVDPNWDESDPPSGGGPGGGGPGGGGPGGGGPGGGGPGGGGEADKRPAGAKPTGERRADVARIYNWVGVHEMALAASVHSDSVGMLDAARRHFGVAMTLEPLWYLPLQNAGDATSYLGAHWLRENRAARGPEVDRVYGNDYPAFDGLRESGHLAQRSARDQYAAAISLLTSGSSRLDGGAGVWVRALQLLQVSIAITHAIELRFDLGDALMAEVFPEWWQREVVESLWTGTDGSRADAELVYAAACFDGWRYENDRAPSSALRALLACLTAFDADAVTNGMDSARTWAREALSDPDLLSLRSRLLTLVSSDMAVDPARGFAERYELVGQLLPPFEATR